MNRLCGPCAWPLSAQILSGHYVVAILGVLRVDGAVDIAQ